MAGQAPHPPWFRMYFPSTRAPAPAPPPPPPTRPPPPTPTVTRPSIPIRPRFPPAQTQPNAEESVPPPPPPPPPAQVAPPPSAPAAQPKSPVAPPATTVSPPRSPVATFTTFTSAPELSSHSTPTTTEVAALEGKAISRPTSSPNVIKPLESALPQSPTTKQPLSSPLTLPPAQFNTTDGEFKLMNEDKNVPEQRNRGIVSGGKTELTTKQMCLSDSEDDWKGAVITLVGENKGALMELVPSKNMNHSVGRVSGEESESSNKDEKNRDVMVQSHGTAFLNSNVQGLNNSLLCDCTYRQNDPGVLLSLNREVNGGRSTMEKQLREP